MQPSWQSTWGDTALHLTCDCAPAACVKWAGLLSSRGSALAALKQSAGCLTVVCARAAWCRQGATLSRQGATLSRRQGVSTKIG